jgi:hypothetical protein
MNPRTEKYRALALVVGTSIVLIGLWPLAGLILMFFKTGLLTSGGLFGIYLPLAVCVVWLVGMPYFISKSRRR